METKMKYIDCVKLLEKCVDTGIINKDKNNAHHLLIYRNAGADKEKFPAGWYSENILDVASELFEDVKGQEILKKACKEKIIPNKQKHSSHLKNGNYDKVFAEMLKTMDFTLDKDNNGFKLFDNQRETYLSSMNSFDIHSVEETDYFRNAMDIADRLENYIADYFVNDLEELGADEGLELNLLTNWKEYADFGIENKDSKFVQDNQFDFDLFNTLSNHINEVSLEQVYLEQEGKNDLGDITATKQIER